MNECLQGVQAVSMFDKATEGPFKVAEDKKRPETVPYNGINVVAERSHVSIHCGKAELVTCFTASRGDCAVCSTPLLPSCSSFGADQFHRS